MPLAPQAVVASAPGSSAPGASATGASVTGASDRCGAGTAAHAVATNGRLVLDAAWEAALLDRLLDGWDERLREQAFRQLGFTGGRF
jgi:hypothetical protein